MDDAMRNLLVRLARRYAGDAAEDVVHDAWLAVWTRYGDEGTQNPRLMARAVKRRALDLLDAERRRATMTTQRASWHGAITDAEAIALTHLEVEQALALAAAERARIVPVPLILLTSVGYTEREIAAAFNLPLTAVKSARWREQQRVRQAAHREAAR